MIKVELIMTIYGYATCSTDEDRQDINRQKREHRIPKKRICIGSMRVVQR